MSSFRMNEAIHDASEWNGLLNALRDPNPDYAGIENVVAKKVESLDNKVGEEERAFIGSIHHLLETIPKHPRLWKKFLEIVAQAIAKQSTNIQPEESPGRTIALTQNPLADPTTWVPRKMKKLGPLADSKPPC